MPLPGPLTTLFIALPDAQVRQSILSDIYGHHHIQLILPDRPSPVRASLGIPDAMLVVLVNVHDPLGWDGYHFALRGTLAQETPNADTAPLLYLRCETEAGTWKDFPLAAWERLIICPGTDLYIQSRWAPTEGKTHTVLGDLETDPRKGSLDKAYKGFQLLRTIERLGGRHPEMDEAAFRQSYWGSYQKVLENKRRDGNKLPRKTEVAAEMLISTQTLRRDRIKYSCPWPPRSPD